MTSSAPVKHAETSKDAGSEAPIRDHPLYGHQEDRHMDEEDVGPSGWGDEDTML